MRILRYDPAPAAVRAFHELFKATQCAEREHASRQPTRRAQRVRAYTERFGRIHFTGESDDQRT